ncbi:MAG: type III secretion HpaP family protein [Puniceicoccales bacterium]|jgi:hypothetical protein|nr:type III secretion HpaP family protein [Puniceicoccales bacterium]
MSEIKMDINQASQGVNRMASPDVLRTPDGRQPDVRDVEKFQSLVGKREEDDKKRGTSKEKEIRGDERENAERSTALLDYSGSRVGKLTVDSDANNRNGNDDYENDDEVVTPLVSSDVEGQDSLLSGILDGIESEDRVLMSSRARRAMDSEGKSIDPSALKPKEEIQFPSDALPKGVEVAKKGSDLGTKIDKELGKEIQIPSNVPSNGMEVTEEKFTDIVNLGSVNVVHSESTNVVHSERERESKLFIPLGKSEGTEASVVGDKILNTFTQLSDVTETKITNAAESITEIGHEIIEHTANSESVAIVNWEEGKENIFIPVGKGEDSEKIDTKGIEIAKPELKDERINFIGNGEETVSMNRIPESVVGDKILNTLTQLSDVTETKITNAAESITKIGHEIIERLMIAQAVDAAKQEMIIVFRDNILPGTHLSLVREGSSLSLSFTATNLQSLDFLIANHGELRDFLLGQMKDLSSVNIRVEQERKYDAANDQQKRQQQDGEEKDPENQDRSQA